MDPSKEGIDNFKSEISEMSVNSDSDPDEEIPIFRFTESDFIVINCDVDAPFDRIFRERWIAAMKAGYMDYPIKSTNSLKKKIISPCKYQFVAALLEGRGPGKRRKPDTMTSLCMPFEPKKFNFTKVKKREYLLYLKSPERDHQPAMEAVILVNKSPIEFGSSLLVPSLNDCLPQVLTEQSLYLAISVVALSDFRSLRVGFNSLGSMASVNHLHWHMFYFDHFLLIEELPVIDNVLQDWPIPALVFEINEINDDFITIIIKDIMRIIEYCIEDGTICQNVFITRTVAGSIKIFLWLSEPRWGLKDNANLNPAFCELSGYFMCKTQQSFETLDERKCLETLMSIVSKHECVLHLLQ